MLKMKKIPFILSVLFIMLLNIYTITAKAEDLQERNATPTITITIQKYGNYSTGTIKPTSLPDSCYIIIAKYINNKCEGVELRKYQTETEDFDIPNEVDMIKVMVWEELDNIKPVTSAKIIDIKANSEIDKKIEKVVAKLKTDKNPNVIRNKIEENEPRAVIWTKGINPPRLSEFEKEVDITDSNYSFLFAGPNKGSGW